MESVLVGGSRVQFPSLKIVSSCLYVNLIYLFHLFARPENSLCYKYDPEKYFSAHPAFRDTSHTTYSIGWICSGVASNMFGNK